MEEKDSKINSEIEKPQEEKHLEPDKKSDKQKRILIIAAIIFMALVLIFVLTAPFLLAKLNPAEKINEAKKANAITPSPSPEPTSTVVPTNIPTIAAKVTVAQKASPTPSGNPTLVVRAGKGVSTVTIHNQSTGKSFSEAISSPGKNYYVDPGAYRITFNEVQDCRPAYSTCYQNCSMTSGHWGWDETGTSANVNVESGKTHAVSLFYADPSSSTNPYTSCKKLQ